VAAKLVRYVSKVRLATGKRLDGAAPPLRASIPEGYGDTGFQAIGVIFPIARCWEVTGEVGETRLTFLTRAVKVEKPK
jgi:hypothetical protein